MTGRERESDIREEFLTIEENHGHMVAGSQHSVHNARGSGGRCPLAREVLRPRI
jgi:hypothetical protein